MRHNFTSSHVLEGNYIRVTQLCSSFFTYSPTLRSLSFVVHKHFSIFSSLPSIESLFINRYLLLPFDEMTTFTTLLVRSKLPYCPRTNLPMGFSCWNNCVTCSYITDRCTNDSLSAAGETTPIPDCIDCNSKNLIYMFNPAYKEYVDELTKG